MMNIGRLLNPSRSFGLKSSLLVLCVTCALVTVVVDNLITISEVRAAPKKAFRRKRHRVRAPKQEEEPAATENLGTLAADLTLRAERGKPFSIDIWLEPKDKNFNRPVTVYMEQTSQVKYEPRVVHLLPGAEGRTTITATVLHTSCGLASIEATADGWEPLSTVVDTGFNAELKTNIIEAIDSGAGKSFIINLVDSDGKPVSLDSELEVTLRGSNIKLWNTDPQDKGWREQVILTMKQGTNSTPPQTIQSDSLIADKALISAAFESEDRAFHNADFWIDVKARWYVPLLLAMLGGILHGIYKMVKESHDPNNSLHPGGVGAVLVGLFTGAVAGALAYLLANWGVLGIKVDTTTLQAFVILGFLFSYVGVDVILKTVTSRDGTREHATAPPPPTTARSTNEIV